MNAILKRFVNKQLETASIWDTIKPWLIGFVVALLVPIWGIFFNALGII